MMTKDDLERTLGTLSKAAEKGSFNSTQANIIAGALLFVASSISDLADAIRSKK